MLKIKSGVILLLIVIVSACQNDVKQEAESKEIEPQVYLADTPLADTSSLVSEKKVSQVPAWVFDKMKSIKLDETYQVADFTKPNFVEGNFNGDDLKDVAVLISNKKTSEKGLLILHNGNNKEYFVYGAGIEIQGMKDLDWIQIFERIPKGETVAETLVDEKSGDIIGSDSLNSVKLKNDGIFLHVAESEGGGIVYWDKDKYKWLHIE